jgi:hypothetical protein
VETAERVVVASRDRLAELPPARKACFMLGLSRHSHAAWMDVPGMPWRSRTPAVGRSCASMVAPSRLTHRCAWGKGE